MAQVSNPPVAETVGAVLLGVTEAVAVLEQPFEVLVTVTVYVPAVLTTGFCSAELNPLGPAQWKVAGEALVVTVSMTVVSTQVISPPVVFTVGG